MFFAEKLAAPDKSGAGLLDFVYPCYMVVMPLRIGSVQKSNYAKLKIKT